MNHAHKKPLVAFYRMTAELLQIISVGATSANGRIFCNESGVCIPACLNAPPRLRARAGRTGGEGFVIEVGSTPRAESRNYAQFCKGHFGWRGELPEAELDESAGSRRGGGRRHHRNAFVGTF